jgi:ribosome-binding protein aMBF1 (putative translation factor)
MSPSVKATRGWECPRGGSAARDPEYMLRTQLERLLARIRQALADKHISERYLAEQLGTSDNQIQRLLYPSILNKNLEQLYRIGLLLGLELEWRIKDAA